MAERPPTLATLLADKLRGNADYDGLADVIGAIAKGALAVEEGTRQAALAGVLGYTNEINVQGEIVDRLDIHNNVSGEGLTPDRLRNADVAIDFSTAEATVSNLTRLAAAGVNAVIGTTGWNDQETSMREVVAEGNMVGYGQAVHAGPVGGHSVVREALPIAGRLGGEVDDLDRQVRGGSGVHRRNRRRAARRRTRSAEARCSAVTRCHLSSRWSSSVASGTSRQVGTGWRSAWFHR